MQFDLTRFLLSRAAAANAGVSTSRANQLALLTGMLDLELPGDIAITRAIAQNEASVSDTSPERLATPDVIEPSAAGTEERSETLQDPVHTYERELAHIRHRIESTQDSMHALQRTLAGLKLDERLGALDASVNALEPRVGSSEERAVRLQSRLDEVATSEQIAVLEGRLNGLAQQITSLDERLIAIDARLPPIEPPVGDAPGPRRAPREPK